MGIGNKISNFADQIQDGVRGTTQSLLAVLMRLLTAFVLGLTLALIGQEVFTYGTILFVFMMLVAGGTTYRIMASWRLGSIFIFDLICVLVALLLRMYILIAP